jgi:toxin YoeB
MDMLTRINTLIENVRRTPFQGIGKPELLKGDLAGFWSRRITGEHRLVYTVAGKDDDQHVFIVQCRYHY